jgi:formylglycine-generating enzyme required for sulfatase activity/dienelactone hydrolase
MNIGDSLLHYRIVSELGRGGMGAVFLAEDRELGREVALKALPPEMAHDAGLLQRFKQEARAIAALNHPNIVTIYSVEVAGDTHFITMELVRGQRLTDLIPPEGLAIVGLLELAERLCDAVAAAHLQGITHRDLKPDNIMIDEEGRLKVLDFGIAKIDPIVDSKQAQSDTTAEIAAIATTEGSLIGTVDYMSPEQAQGKPVGPSSDVFSLGIVLYEMATGHRPFKGDNKFSVLASIIRDTPEPASSSSHRIPSLFDQIISRCIQKEASDRYDTAEGLKDDLVKLHERVSPEAVSRRNKLRVGLTAAAVLVFAVVTAGVWVSRHNARVRWARNEALPAIEQLLEQTSFLERGTTGWEARDLAEEAARYLGDDPALATLQGRIGREVSITTDPPGADIYATAYTSPEGPWRYLGRTPIDTVRFTYGSSRLKIELDGHAAVEDLRLDHNGVVAEWAYTLHPDGEIPEEMVWVAGGSRDLRLPGIDHLEPQETPAFLIDRYEVSNQEYKRFVDAGGYENAEFWTEPFVKDGSTLTHDDAMALFRDATGRAGPDRWEVGDYPAGQDDYPVSGISWFEAAAYANFAGKSLPTLYHWNQVAETYSSGEIVPMSNFGGEGLAPVGSYRGLHRYGAYDLAGNVREWCQNPTTNSEARFILGGGWNDPGYAFNDAYAQSPWDRTSTNGVRGMRYLDPTDERPALTQTIELPFRDFYAETPVSDETFEIYRRQFDYDRTPLNATIQAEDDYEDWTRQRVTFDAAYGNERVMAYLYVPKRAAPSYQTVVMFPGSNAIHADSSEGVTGERFSYLMKSGRAVIHPIYKGTYERGDELDSDYPDETSFYKEHVIMWGKDLARSIDYLESREDMDTDRLAYIGYSWGGAMGTIMPAVEPRIKVNVLVVAGLLFQRALPEVDQVTYVSRVTQPTIMINGEYDFFFPVETSQKPLYDLLGAPEEHKKYVVFAGSHSISRSEMLREVFDWLDQYQ